MSETSFWHLCVTIFMIALVLSIAIPAMICNLPTNVTEYLKKRKEWKLELARVKKEQAIEVAKIQKETELGKASMENEWWKKATDNMTQRVNKEK